MIYKFIISIMLLICSVNLLLAGGMSEESSNCNDKRFWNDGNADKGWYWKKECVPIVSDPIVESKDNYTILEDTQNIPWDKIDRIDPDQIAKIIEPQARKVAITYPTEENILEYRKLSQWIQNKTVAFMNEDRMVRTENPNDLLAGLMNSSKRGHFESSVSRVVANENVDNILKNYSQKAGLIIFVSPTCEFCKRQIPILNELKRKYGFDYVTIDVSGKNEMIEKFGIETTPDIFLAVNSNGTKYQRIATGLHTLPDMISAIIYGLKYLGEDVDENTIN